MTGDREWLSSPMGACEATSERAELRGAAAGVVAGLGAFFVVQHLATDLEGLVAGGLYDAPFVLLSVALLYTGYWLLRCDLDHRRIARVALWSLAGFIVLVSVGVWLAGDPTADVGSAAKLAVDVGTVGASSGLLVGLCGERRTRTEREADRAVERAEERFAFFNRMLRHHLLNGVAVVRGHAELLGEEYDAAPEGIEIIRRRSDEMVHLVRNVETLSRAFTGDLSVHPVHPGPHLHSAVESAREGGAAIDLGGDPVDGRRVLANDRLRVVFEAVVDATTDAADDGPLEVTTVERRDEFVATVAFSGSFGEGADALDAGDHGDGHLGLFIADTLVEYFGGSLDLTEEAGRSTLRVRLPFVDRPVDLAGPRPLDRSD